MPAPGQPARHLYVHLPFCAARCGYCAFVVEVGRPEAHARYVDAVIAEIAAETAAGRLGELDTVYLGGGTPTLLDTRELVRLLGAIGPQLAPGAEVSIEANPETVTSDLLAALLDAGVTRVSMGVQSFQPELLAMLDRAAGPDRCREAIRIAREAGVPSLSLDLLFGVPGQSPELREADLAEVLAAAPDHVSWYELELKPGSALGGRADLRIDDDASAEHYERIVEVLQGAGYRWYETANFAREGHACRHNLAYWTGRDHIGVGVGAVGTLRGTRRRNRPGVDAYVAELARGRRPAASEEVLDAATLRRERWMLALRLDTPIDLEALGSPDHPEAVGRLVDAGLATSDTASLRLTPRGRFLQNAVAGALIDFG